MPSICSLIMVGSEYVLLPERRWDIYPMGFILSWPKITLFMWKPVKLKFIANHWCTSYEHKWCIASFMFHTTVSVEGTQIKNIVETSGLLLSSKWRSGYTGRISCKTNWWRTNIGQKLLHRCTGHTDRTFCQIIKHYNCLLERKIQCNNNNKKVKHSTKTKRTIFKEANPRELSIEAQWAENGIAKQVEQTGKTTPIRRIAVRLQRGPKLWPPDDEPSLHYDIEGSEGAPIGPHFAKIRHSLGQQKRVFQYGKQRNGFVYLWKMVTTATAWVHNRYHVGIKLWNQELWNLALESNSFFWFKNKK